MLKQESSSPRLETCSHISIHGYRFNFDSNNIELSIQKFAHNIIVPVSLTISSDKYIFNQLTITCNLVAFIGTELKMSKWKGKVTFWRRMTTKMNDWGRGNAS